MGVPVKEGAAPLGGPVEKGARSAASPGAHALVRLLLPGAPRRIFSRQLQSC